MPNKNIRDSEIVFGDLIHAFNNLREEKRSPVNVRRYFKSFIELSQQLTFIMYKEYPKLTGEEWTSDKFKGWNEATNLLKELRNTDSHESPILIKVNETQLHFNNDTHFFVIFTRDLGDPFSDEIPDWCNSIIEGDPVTGMPLYDKQEEPREIYPSSENEGCRKAHEACRYK